MRFHPVINPAFSRPSWIALAGLAGGFAEVAWVAVYAAVTGQSGWNVAREITVTVFGSPVGGAWAPWLGLATHFALALALAAGFAYTFRNLLRIAEAGFDELIAASILVLCAIWAMNFFVLLPRINPAFVALLPLPVTLASKMLFGIAMGGVFCAESDVWHAEFAEARHLRAQH